MLNNLHKSLIIAFLAVSIFISGLAADFVDAKITAVGTAASRRPLDPIPIPILKFGQISTEDGLSTLILKNNLGGQR